MSEQSSEKRHQPSKKKLDDLKKKGQVLRSRDLNSGLVLVAMIIFLLFFCDYLGLVLNKNLKQSLDGVQVVLHNENHFYEIIRNIFERTAITLSFMAIFVFILTFLSPLLFGGWNFSISSVGFKAEKLSMAKNLKKIFSMQNIVEILKSSLKIVLILFVVIGFVLSNYQRLTKLSGLDVSVSIFQSYQLVREFLGWLAVIVFLIIPIDLLMSYWQFQQQAKMTTQELKDEQKETDGNPESKRRIRSRQMSMLMQSINTAVPQATVLITNPTHYAVALQYRDGIDKAPKIIAKGTDLIAKRMRHIAICNGVSIYEAPVLARAIYYTSKIGSEIHTELYMAVALVLSYIHQLKNYQMGQGHFPNAIEDLKVPENFVFPEHR